MNSIIDRGFSGGFTNVFVLRNEGLIQAREIHADAELAYWVVV